MSIKYLIEFTEHVYGRIAAVLNGVTEEELGWRPMTEMNTAGKVLRHMARISLILLPQVVKGRTTGRWNDDYEEKEHSLAELLRDLEAGRVGVLGGLRELKTEDFEVAIPLWGGSHRRIEGVYTLVGELIYHTGQIALIRGAHLRTKKT